MRTSTGPRMLGIAALCSAILLLPAGAAAQDDPGDRAIEARQGFMQIVVWEAGPLFGMAKGDIAYDAETATDNAESLQAVLNYPVDRLFIEGTSKADRPGDTRALGAIWEDPEAFGQAYADLRDAFDGVVEVAGDGQQELAGAVQEMGQACGNCHEDFRADEF